MQNLKLQEALIFQSTARVVLRSLHISRFHSSIFKQYSFVEDAEQSSIYFAVRNTTKN